jgi:capsular exopolysaccharide synthesis family protein
VVRTNLSFISPQKPLQSILVASASPQEGKTSVVANLGITIAKSNLKTILIDTDMRRPRLHKVLRLPNDNGVSNLVIGNKTLEQVTKKIPGVENLDILTCGPIPPNPSELVSTDRFKELLATRGRNTTASFWTAHPSSP